MASEIRVDKINSLSGVGTVTLSPTGVDIAGITTAATLKATTGIVTTLTATTGIVTTLTTNTLTANSTTKVGSGVTLSPDGDIFATGVTTTTQFKVTTGANAFETSANVFKGASGQKGVYLRSALSAEDTPSYSSVDDTNAGIFLPGSDVFGVTTGGSERLRITSDGTIHVNSSDSASGGRIYATGSALYLQSGNGRQTIKVSDASAGVNRTIEMTSAGNLAFPNGNGIDFSATSDAAGMTSELLHEYEEGSWTPSFANLDVPGHVTVNYATYTRIGRLVIIRAQISVSSSINDGSGFGFTLPFTPASSQRVVIPAISDRSGSNKEPFAMVNANQDSSIYAKALEGYAFQSYNTFSSNYLVVTGCYESA